MQTWPDAKSYLTYLQETEYAKRGIQLTDFTKQIEKVISDYKEMTRKYLEKDFISTYNKKESYKFRLDDRADKLRNLFLPTKYENPVIYKILIDMFKEIEKISHEPPFDSDPMFSPMNGSSYTRSPIVGTLPTGNVNAVSVAVPGISEYLLIFEHDIFNFCYLLSKVVSNALPFNVVSIMNGEYDLSDIQSQFSVPDFVIKRWTLNPIILRRFQEILLAPIVMGTTSAVSRYDLEQPYALVAGSITTSMELFIMGHEYSHIRLGHVEQDGIEMTVSNNLENVEEINYSKQMEFEADRYGILLAINAMYRRGYDVFHSYIGCDLFFTFMDILNRVMPILRDGKEISNDQFEDSTSHPTSIERRNIIRSFIARQYGDDVVCGGVVAEKIVQNLWKDSVPVLMDIHEKTRNHA